jgi:hypothetical protein
MADAFETPGIHVDVNGVMAMLESVHTDHIDVEAEEAQIQKRAKSCDERIYEFMSTLDGDSYTEDELIRITTEAGLWDGFEKDQLNLVTLGLIRKLRQRRN